MQDQRGPKPSHGTEIHATRSRVVSIAWLRWRRRPTCDPFFLLAFHFLSTGFLLAFHFLSSAFPSPIHCLSTAFPWPIHCLSTACSLTFSLPIHCLFLGLFPCPQVLPDSLADWGEAELRQLMVAAGVRPGASKRIMKEIRAVKPSPPAPAQARKGEQDKAATAPRHQPVDAPVGLQKPADSPPRTSLPSLDLPLPFLDLPLPVP